MTEATIEMEREPGTKTDAANSKKLSLYEDEQTTTGVLHTCCSNLFLMIFL